jgi:hypothetical protein
MNFVRFLENRFQELRYQQSVEELKDVAFNAPLDSELKATHNILNHYRTLLRWVFTPKILGHYVLVQLKLLPEPEPILLNKIKAQKEAEDAAKAAVAASPNVTSLHPDVNHSPQQTPA